MDAYSMARKVSVTDSKMVGVSGIRLGWMDNVKVALSNRGMKMEAVRQCAKARRTWGAPVESRRFKLTMSYCLVHELFLIVFPPQTTYRRRAITWC